MRIEAQALKLLADLLLAATVVVLVLWLAMLSLTGVKGEDLPALITGIPAYGAFAAVGLLIVNRQPTNLIGWLCGGLAFVQFVGFLVGDYVYYAYDVAEEDLPLREVAAALPTLIWPYSVLGPPLLIPSLFPDGTPLSWRWAIPVKAGVVLLVLIGLTTAFIGDDSQSSGKSPLVVAGARQYLEIVFAILLPAWAVCFCAGVISFLLRFKRSTGQSRLQMKWFAFALAIAFILVVANDEVTLYGADSNVLFNIGLMLIALAIGGAVLRHRLYDIDLIIRRTLVYGLLTAVLASVYLGLVLGLRYVFQPITGSTDLAIAVTTLSVAALFLPARQWVQRMVDRRFNRRSYDAARTLEEFGARLRQNIDLDTLRYELLSVVDETMEPSRLTIWLREPAGRT